MGTGVRQKYNVALNSKGYILKGAPGQPLYDKRVIQSQVDRLAISDIQYSDFSGANLFYVAQTDWSAGIKDEKKWRDDGKFLYSANIDVYSEQGAIKLERQVTQVGSSLAAGADVTCGTYGEVDSVKNTYIGTEDATADNKPRVYYLDGSTWTSLFTFSGTNQNVVSQMFAYKNKLYIFAVGSGNTEVVQSWDGSSVTDHSSGILTASTLTGMGSSRCAAELGGLIYFGIDDTTNNKIAILSYDGTTFTEEVYIETNAIPISMAAFSGKIYYFLNNSNTLELRVFDPSTSTDETVRTFYNTNTPNWGVGEKLLRVFGGKLIITVPLSQIYDYDGSDLRLIFTRDASRTQTSATDLGIALNDGCLEKDNKLYWGNLIYDGEVFFNHKQNAANSNSYDLIPVTTNSSGTFYYFDEENPTNVYIDSDSAYKSEDGENYLVMSEMDQISSIDKLLDNITIIFDKLATGTEIEVDYSIDDRSTWVTIGNVTASNDANITKRVFTPASTVKFNKIWIRIKLNTTTTSNTPIVRDVILAYKPFPDFKVRWSMTVDASKQISLLDGNQEQRTGMEISNELWNLLNLKQKVILEDTDFFECALQTALTSSATSARIDTNRPIPRAGRVRAITSGYVEEMYYTSANNDRIWGITRGARGTKARAYAIGTALKNDYDVYVDSVDTKIDVTDENKQENRVQLVLTEG